MALIFLALAAVGHAVLWVALINRIHGVGIRRVWVDSLTLVFLAAGVSAPLLITWALYNQPAGSLRDRLVASPTSEIYVVLCVLVLVVASVHRWLQSRRDRGCRTLLSDHVTRVDLPAKPATYIASGRFYLVARAPLNEVLQVRLHDKQLAIPRLAAVHDGLKIAHVTDLHFCGRIEREFFEHVVDETNAASPDIVAITGDIMEGDQFLDWIPSTLGRLRARHGVYYVLGNHDRRATVRLLHAALADAGLVHVGGRWLQISVEGSPIIVAGNELPWFKPAPDFRDCPNSKEGGRPLRLLLAHSPDQFSWAQKSDIDLMLAGHLHGGQARLPVLGAITSPSIHGVRYVCGVFREGNTVLHVSRGVGSLTPLRFNCPPELAVLTLRACRS
jgi:predicted MPP superfamily phosphohydrolase